MPNNDPANDMFNPPDLNSKDFEQFTFGELEVDELFWQTNQPGDNYSWRKVNQTQAMNLRKQTTHNFESKTVVFQKI
tara:strand:+ start:433 stop:663 length:231 start_codon:yes stop_codon:yes gene_type:complete